MPKIGEISYSTEGGTPQIEVAIPKGTAIKDILKLQELISKEVISKISPRGCQACLSGVHLNIRERLENVIRVDLEKNAIMH